MNVFGYVPGEGGNWRSITKTSLDKPSVYIDFAGGLLAAATIGSVGATGLSSTGAVNTVNVVGTTTFSGTVGRIDLRTGGATVGTLAATDQDQYRIRVTATPDVGGPIYFDIHVLIDDAAYAP